MRRRITGRVPPWWPNPTVCKVNRPLTIPDPTGLTLVLSTLLKQPGTPPQWMISGSVILNIPGTPPPSPLTYTVSSDLQFFTAPGNNPATNPCTFTSTNLDSFSWIKASFAGVVRRQLNFSLHRLLAEKGLL